MNLSTLKYLASAIILIGNIISSWLPMKIKKSEWITFANSMAGGVFIGASFIHMIPNSLKMINQQLCLLTIVFSYFLMTLFESFFSPDLKLLNEEENDSMFLSPQVLFLYLMIHIHSFFESLSLGIINEEKTFYSLFFAIIAHKPVVCFSLGLIILNENKENWIYLLLMGIFIFSSPLITIFFTIIPFSTSKSFVGFMNSISAGVFIFVGFHELNDLLLKKLSKKHKIYHLLLYFIGQVWMGLVLLIKS